MNHNMNEKKINELLNKVVKEAGLGPNDLNAWVGLEREGMGVLVMDENLKTSENLITLSHNLLNLALTKLYTTNGPDAAKSVLNYFAKSVVEEIDKLLVKH